MTRDKAAIDLQGCLPGKYNQGKLAEKELWRQWYETTQS